MDYDEAVVRWAHAELGKRARVPFEEIDVERSCVEFYFSPEKPPSAGVLVQFAWKDTLGRVTNSWTIEWDEKNPMPVAELVRAVAECGQMTDSLIDAAPRLLEALETCVNRLGELVAARAEGGADVRNDEWILEAAKDATRRATSPTTPTIPSAPRSSGGIQFGDALRPS